MNDSVSYVCSDVSKYFPVTAISPCLYLVCLQSIRKLWTQCFTYKEQVNWDTFWGAFPMGLQEDSKVKVREDSCLLSVHRLFEQN